MAAPIFIGGMLKSGTSLVRAMLGRHSRIFAGLETYWFDLDWNAVDGSPWLSHIARISGLYGREVGPTIRMAQKCSSPEEFLDVFMTYNLPQGRTRWAEKTPANVCHVPRIMAYWPDATIIHVLRDPRDIWASMRQAGKLHDAHSFVRRWASIVPSALEFERAMAGTNQFHTVRYEDVIADPESEMRKLLTAIGESFERQTAEHRGKPEDFETVYNVTGVSSTTLERLSKPLESGRVGIWRTFETTSFDEQLHEAARQVGVESSLANVLSRY